ncbi:Retrotransposon-derived protein PEG10 [Rhizoctonia solani]|uniref:Retrotransposon-derived protein PEG10 n=1 Tax=Rhizoctonia solani TaxID=456999 RepID=A0A8H8T1A2_9AGAM|nr:Retrotransposon-derived protein PEG10 [Rhizoctonia solani]QRW25604.1 Retrotransposon-derived protein PEG10 [Rhizoctonia solani]
MLQDVTQAVESAIQRLLTAPSSTDPHTPPRRVFTVIDNTLSLLSQAAQATRTSQSLSRMSLTQKEKGSNWSHQNHLKQPQTLPGQSHTQDRLELNPAQPFIRPTPVGLPNILQAATTQPGETDEEKEARTLHNIATIMGRALSVPLQRTFRGLSQTLGPAQVKSKIPALEKYDGKKGPAAKSLILDCKTYFLSNASSFPADHK